MSVFVEQVGGDHYQALIQHWDIIELYDVSYLEAQASRYVSRWRKKNGPEDLRKALTFIKKMDGRPTRRRVPREALWAWFNACKMHASDAEIIKLILQEDYGSTSFLELAASLTEELLETAEKGA